jgi:hypothetical protein
LAELSGVLADQPLDGAGDLRQDLGMTDEQFRQRVLAGLDQIKYMIFGIAAVIGVWYHYFR